MESNRINLIGISFNQQINGIEFLPIKANKNEMEFTLNDPNQVKYIIPLIQI